MKHKLLSTIALAGLALAIGTSAGAARDHHGSRGVPSHVVTESRFGHGRIAAPVRMTARGPEIRLPRGTWIPCRKSCSETLRVETVDFWENQGRSRIDNECGIFGCLKRGFDF